LIKVTALEHCSFN